MSSTPNTNDRAAADADEAPAEGADVGATVADAYVIPRALAQATVDYLAMQPYREVYALVRGFEALEPLPNEVRPGSRPA